MQANGEYWSAKLALDWWLVQIFFSRRLGKICGGYAKNIFCLVAITAAYGYIYTTL